MKISFSSIINAFYIILAFVVIFGGAWLLGEFYPLIYIVISATTVIALYVYLKKDSKLKRNDKQSILGICAGVVFFLVLVLGDLGNKVESQMCDILLSGKIKTHTVTKIDDDDNEYDEDEYNFI